MFVWTLMTYLHAEPHKHVVVHCTHGYNRTGASPPLHGLLTSSASHTRHGAGKGCSAAPPAGYMLVNYMVRHGLSVADALQVFAKHRPPGIYKAHYIEQLFKYNHELACGPRLFAARPPWSPACGARASVRTRGEQARACGAQAAAVQRASDAGLEAARGRRGRRRARARRGALRRCGRAHLLRGLAPDDWPGRSAAPVRLQTRPSRCPVTRLTCATTTRWARTCRWRRPTTCGTSSCRRHALPRACAQRCAARAAKRGGRLQVQGVAPGMAGRVFFPGSQPVSLARSNMGLLSERRYWVTWKADGTRYMLLLCRWGVGGMLQRAPLC